MRYFLLCLAAFVLLAVPAFAVNPSNDTTVDVTVTIADAYIYTINAPDISFAPLAADIDAGVTAQNAITWDGTAKTNFGWTCQAAMTAFTGSWAALAIDVKKLAPAVGVWQTLTTSATTIVTGGPGIVNYSFGVRLSGLTWTMLPAAGPQTSTVTFTYF